MNPHLERLVSRVDDGALAPEHFADLSKSALGDEIIRKQHPRSAPPSMIGRLLGFDLSKVTSAMLFPYPSVDGGFMPVIRLEMFRAQLDGEVRGFKYAQPKGSSPASPLCAAICLREVLEGAGRLLIVDPSP